MSNLVFVDCEADGGPGRESQGGDCPATGRLTQIGAVLRGEDGKIRTFYADLRLPTTEGQCWDSRVQECFALFGEWLRIVVPKGRRPVMVSDNPAYDWQWINDGFRRMMHGHNPFGHSARRIGDFYAGLCGDFRRSNEWKRLRVTKHTHNPVDDAMGNLEAFERMLKGERA